MKEFIVKNKVVLAVIAIILVGALLVGVIALGKGAGNNDNTKPTGDSQGATQGTEDNAKPTDPSNETNPSDGTKPSDGTEPSEDNTEPSDGTEPSSGATDPSEDQTELSEGTEPSTEPTQGETEPPVTNPPVTEPPVTNPPETEPPVTNPPQTEPPVTNPPETEPPVVTQPSTYPTEPKDEGYKGVTPDNLSEETVEGWDATDYSKFKGQYWHEMSYQEQYDFLVLQQNNGVYYRCGANGHHCMTPFEHEQRVAFICSYCGKNDCAGWGLRDETMDAYYPVNCPEYNVFKDPSEYCQTCGKRCFIIGVSSILEGCNYNYMDGPCYYCGEPAFGCHTCKRENLKPEFEQYIIP